MGFRFNSSRFQIWGQSDFIAKSMRITKEKNYTLAKLIRNLETIFEAAKNYVGKFSINMYMSVSLNSVSIDARIEFHWDSNARQFDRDRRFPGGLSSLQRRSFFFPPLRRGHNHLRIHASLNASATVKPVTVSYVTGSFTWRNFSDALFLSFFLFSPLPLTAAITFSSSSFLFLLFFLCLAPPPSGEPSSFVPPGSRSFFGKRNAIEPAKIRADR